jgi:hypothetical protein
MVTEGSTLLGFDELTMPTALNVNRSFAVFMRKRHPAASQDNFSTAVFVLPITLLAVLASSTSGDQHFCEIVA